MVPYMNHYDHYTNSEKIVCFDFYSLISGIPNSIITKNIFIKNKYKFDYECCRYLKKMIDCYSQNFVLILKYSFIWRIKIFKAHYFITCTMHFENQKTKTRFLKLCFCWSYKSYIFVPQNQSCVCCAACNNCTKHFQKHLIWCCFSVF